MNKTVSKNTIDEYDGPQCPNKEMVCDTIDQDLHKLIDKEFESKKLADLFMLALILVLILFLLM
jgi:hypothetical protein